MVPKVKEAVRDALFAVANPMWVRFGITQLA